MNVNKGHKSPRKVRVASKPIERVSTKKLLESIKRDIQREIVKPESSKKAKKRGG